MSSHFICVSFFILFFAILPIIFFKSFAGMHPDFGLGLFTQTLSKENLSPTLISFSLTTDSRAQAKICFPPQIFFFHHH